MCLPNVRSRQLTYPWVYLQDFLNGVCTHIIWLTKQKLTYYTGNYDTFCKTVKENEVIQQKKYEKEQDDIKHLKAFISSCGKINVLLYSLFFSAAIAQSCATRVLEFPAASCVRMTPASCGLTHTLQCIEFMHIS